MTEPLEFSVLGPLRVASHGAPLPLGGPKQRCVLAMLLLEPNRVVSVDRLIDGVWGDEPHERATSTLQVYVSNLRKLLGPERILTERPGYRAVVTPDELDLTRFDTAVKAGNDHTAAGRHEAAAAAFATALDTWSGEAVADLEHAVAATPLREHRWAQLILALYRSGRQADALAAFGTARNTLLDELGIDPGAPLRALETAILNQDPSLDWNPAAPAGSTGATTTIRRAPAGSVPTLTLPNGTRLELTDRSWIIGRSTDTDIVLASPDVSRRHAELRTVDGGWTISDLGSTNGLTVNGTEVTDYHLGDGDEIAIGRFSLVFHSGATAPT